MKRLYLFILIILNCLWLVSGCDTATVIEETEKTAEKGSYSLSVKDNLVTLLAREAELREVLRELAEKAGIEIDLDPEVRERISISFEALSLEAAFRRITPNYSVVFIKEVGKNEFRITKVVIPASSKLAEIKSVPGSSSEEGDRKAGVLTDRSGADETETAPVEEIKTSPAAKEEAAPSAQYVKDELVIRFKLDLTPAAIEALVREKDASIKEYIEEINYYVLKLPENLSVDEAAAFFKGKEAVEHVEPNYLIPVEAVPNDPRFGDQWALRNTGLSGGKMGADINAVPAWDINKGQPGIIVAVIDTGVDYNHGDLAANIWVNGAEIPDDGIDNDGNGYVDDIRGWDFIDGISGVTPAQGEDTEAQDNDPMDIHGHGTFMAGIVGAVTDNGRGMAGVAWNCRIMPVRAGFKTSDGGGLMVSVAAARGILYAARNGARVINLSWGNYYESDLIKTTLKEACDLGVIICAAAGNEGKSTPIYPAGSPFNEIIAVGATDFNDQKPEFSNYGDWVDVSAPGVDIISTYPGNKYYVASGTSLAAPHVAGLAALLFSHFDNISTEEVKAKIMSSVDVLPALAGMNTSSGRINALKALTAEDDPPGSVSTTSSPSIPVTGGGGRRSGCFISVIGK